MTSDSPPSLTLIPSEAQLTRSVNGRRAYRRRGVPGFYPVPTRTRQFTLSAWLAGRRRGWTVERQADFLGLPAETDSVIGACEAVGISRKSACRLRARPGAESFAAAWNAALGGEGRKVTAPPRDPLDCAPLVRLFAFRGRYGGAWYTAADGAVRSHTRRPGGAGQRDTVSAGW